MNDSDFYLGWREYSLESLKCLHSSNLQKVVDPVFDKSSNKCIAP